MDIKYTRNFCIIAHIDHGKSTLADRFLQMTKSVNTRDFKDQMLDSMDLEREKGITIKLSAVRIFYNYEGEDYQLNLIDTPGHVDFSYEVSRSLMACEGAVLVVDASQGIEAQTLSNLYLAIDNGLTIIPVINKIDTSAADIEKTKKQLTDLGFNDDEIISVSAKTGLNCEDVLKEIVRKIPYPKGDSAAPLKALVFDSVFDNYRGVISYIRVVDGSIKAGDEIMFYSTENKYEVTEVGVFTPPPLKRKILNTGGVGYMIAGIKSIEEVKTGDTITSSKKPCASPLPGFKEIKPMVFCGLYPVEDCDFNDLREALLKLKLNDSALFFEPDNSPALGFGFKCGFLGLLHMEIVIERLEREYNLNILATTPNVKYILVMAHGEEIELYNPADFPETSKLDHIKEPFVKITVMCPDDYIGGIMKLCQEKRGVFVKMEHIDTERVMIIYQMPLNEIVMDFYDKLKSCSSGYASFDYEFMGYRRSELVKVDVLLNKEKVDSLSFMVHSSKAYDMGSKLCSKLKDLIPRHQFSVPIQASIGSKVIARETIKALKKNVTAKCYGGDITRKRKLIEKQKEGKKRMKNIGSVNVPQDAFLAVLKLNS